MLILLMGVIYNVHRWDGIRWHDIHTKSHDDLFGHSRVISQQFERLQCWYYWWEGFMMCTAEMASGGMINIPSFMKVGAGVQVLFSSEIWEATLLVLLMGRIYVVHHWDGLSCLDVHTKFHKDWLRHLIVNMGDTHTDIQTARWFHRPNFNSLKQGK
jgi:hypothetical protein